MNKTILAIGSCLVALMAVMPAAGTHVNNTQLGLYVTPGPTTTLPVPVTAGDFLLAGSPLILCESIGGSDPVNTGILAVEDPNLPGTYITYAEGQSGVGGLCYAGRNGASGTLPSATGDYTKFDLCTYPVLDLVNGPSTGCAGGIGMWAFQANLGVYSCYADVGQSFLYDETYAAMTWNAPATGGNSHVAAFPDLLQSLAPVTISFPAPPGLPTVTPGTIPSPLTVHATSNPTALVIGSAVTSALSTLPGTEVGCGGAPTADGPVWIL